MSTDKTEQKCGGEQGGQFRLTRRSLMLGTGLAMATSARFAGAVQTTSPRPMTW